MDSVLTNLSPFFDYHLTVCSLSAPAATFSDADSAPSPFSPSRGWPNCLRREQLRALPDPPGTIPKGGMLPSWFQSFLAKSP